MACGSNAEPMQMDIVHEAESLTGALTRGIFFGIYWAFGAQPSFHHNDTVFRSWDSCHASFNACRTELGGDFIEKDAAEVGKDTYQAQTLDEWKGVDKYQDDASFFQDTLVYGDGGRDTYNVEEFPFVVESNLDGQHIIGLGPKSTFMSYIVKSNERAFSSKVIGLNYGSASPNRTRDGDIVFGGFDRAAIDFDTMTNFDIVPGCGICLTVKSLSYTTDGEQDPGLFWTGSFLINLNTPEHDYMGVPQEYLLSMRDTLSIDSNTDNAPSKTGLLFVPDDKAKGTLQIELTGDFEGNPSNFTTIVPKHELFNHRSIITDEGDLIPKTNESQVLRLSSGGASPFTWGHPFLSQHYLIVDWENGRFNLARIRQDVLDSDDDWPKPMIAPSYRSYCGSGGLSGGAIAGIVVGVVVGVAGIAAVVWFFIRRNQRVRAVSSTGHQLEGVKAGELFHGKR